MTAQKIITLSKNYSREHSLFYMSIWNEGNVRDRSPTLPLNINNILIVKEPNGNKIAVWYDNSELAQFNQRILDAYSKRPTLFHQLEKDFNTHFNWLFPYLSHEKKVQSMGELEAFYNHLVSFWSPMSIFFVIPNDERFPKEIRERGLKLRTESQRYTDKEDEIFVHFFESQFPKYRDITYNILPNEVFKLKNDQLTNQELVAIKNRKNGVVILNGEWISLSNLPQALKEKGLRLEDDQPDSTQVDLKGRVTFKLHDKSITGKVRKVLKKKQIRLVLEGEILVTTMTSPDYIPAMKKAAAIITDEGGVTCHAAIASRELAKPCIVGTHHATKILQDGDLIQIDLVTGHVRKIIP